MGVNWGVEVELGWGGKPPQVKTQGPELPTMVLTTQLG